MKAQYAIQGNAEEQGKALENLLRSGLLPRNQQVSVTFSDVINSDGQVIDDQSMLTYEVE